MSGARWTSKDLEALKAAALGRKAAEVPKGETSNRMKANILRAINMQPGCAAYRINNVGVWDEQKGVYRKGNTQKGIADIAAVIRGKSVWIEVKAGRDKLSRDQIIFRQEIIGAGGIYYEARSTDAFLDFLTELLKSIRITN